MKIDLKVEIILRQILEVGFTLIWIVLFICTEVIEEGLAGFCLGMTLPMFWSWCGGIGAQVYQELKNQGCRGDIFGSRDFWVGVLAGLFLRCNLCLRIFLLMIFIFGNWMILGGLYDCIAIHVALIVGWLLCEFLFARQKYFAGLHGKDWAKRFAAGACIVVLWLGVSVLAGRHMENRSFAVFYQAIVEHEEQQQDLPWTERTHFYPDYRRGKKEPPVYYYDRIVGE